MELLGMATILLMVFISLLFLSAIWKNGTHKKGKLPPGPPPLPILGNALQLRTSHLDQTLCKISEKHGPVFTVHFGREPVVVLYGYDAIREALVDHAEEFAGRGRMPLVDKVRKGRGILFSNGETWKQLRRFALTTLRNFGMGKKSIEERIQEEVQYLMDELWDTKGKPFDPTFLLKCATSNVIASIVFGKHYGYNDQKLLAMMALMDDNFNIINSFWGQLTNTFPSLMDLIPGPHHRVMANSLKAMDFLLEEVKEHRATLDPSSPRDFIDCFCIRMDQAEHDGDSEFTIENLVACALDLFVAGTEMTSTTLKSGLLILLKYPKVEEKVQEEIDRVVGRSQRPCMADRGQMPYTDAVLHEIQRFISLAPLGLPRAVIKDTPFRKYVIPEGTTVFPVLTSVLHDSKEFPSPREFDPQHFLNEDGTFRKSDYFMPFAASKRVCIGQGLTQVGLFLFLTTILQNFKLKPLTDPKDISIASLVSNVTTVLQPYQLCLVPR